ncbi:hypothetical protein BGC30_01180 [Novacetimonas hansenii]|nr:hypothetical protein BGC30_01180 [Novacetimonas hansenii]
MVRGGWGRQLGYKGRERIFKRSPLFRIVDDRQYLLRLLTANAGGRSTVIETRGSVLRMGDTMEARK